MLDRRTFLGAALALPALSTTTYAAASTDTVLAKTRRCAEKTVGDGAPAAVCMVLHKGNALTGGAGRGPRGALPDEHTVFQLGSITKTLTATALAREVVVGRLDLDDSVRTGLPLALSTVDKRITYEQLSSHFSGLPRLPATMQPLLTLFPRDPYAHFTFAALAAGIPLSPPTTTPGSTYGYSNYGVGLLGIALAHQRRRSVDQLLHERVTGPLRMADTTTTLTANMRTRKVVGTDATGKATPDWHDHVLQAAGSSMFSTGADLARYLGHQLNSASSPLPEAIELTQRPRRDLGNGGAVGLGWHHQRMRNGHNMVWHNGGTGGFNTFAGFCPEKRTAVVLLANRAFGEQSPVDVNAVELLIDLTS